jgi:hypothetical protein
MCFRIIQYILVHLLVLIISETFINLTILSFENDRSRTVTSLSAADPTNLSFLELLSVVFTLRVSY